MPPFSSRPENLSLSVLLKKICAWGPPLLPFASFYAAERGGGGPEFSSRPAMNVAVCERTV